eukprot:SAG11_NODE_3771_length_2236_cov_2.717829_4_plen_62_part_00
MGGGRTAGIVAVMAKQLTRLEVPQILPGYPIKSGSTTVSLDCHRGGREIVCTLTKIYIIFI